MTIEATLEEATSGESSHEVTITGLKENTTYNYRFGDGKGIGVKLMRLLSEETKILTPILRRSPNRI